MRFDWLRSLSGADAKIVGELRTETRCRWRRRHYRRFLSRQRRFRAGQLRARFRFLRQLPGELPKRGSILRTAAGYRSTRARALPILSRRLRSVVGGRRPAMSVCSSRFRVLELSCAGEGGDLRSGARRLRVAASQWALSRSVDGAALDATSEPGDAESDSPHSLSLPLSSPPTRRLSTVLHPARPSVPTPPRRPATAASCSARRAMPRVPRPTLRAELPERSLRLGGLQVDQVQSRLHPLSRGGRAVGGSSDAGVEAFSRAAGDRRSSMAAASPSACSPRRPSSPAARTPGSTPQCAPLRGASAPARARPPPNRTHRRCSSTTTTANASRASASGRSGRWPARPPAPTARA